MTMTPRQAYLRLGGILLLFGLLSLAQSIALPLHKAPDEIAHFRYSQFIARHGRLPLNQAEREAAGYLSFWPPLYHASVAVSTGWSNQDGPPHLKFVWQSPRFELAQILLDTKRLANTEDEQWPYQGEILMWHLGRVVSILFSIGTVVVTFFVALEIWPNQYRRAVWAAALLAFIPTFVFISSVMSYESLVGLVTALYFWLLVKIVKKGATVGRCLGLGALLGLAVTVKYAAAIMPLEVAAVLGYLVWRQRQNWLRWVKAISLVGGAAIVASSWWFGFLILHFNEIDQFGPVVGALKPILAGGIDASQNYVASLLTGSAIGQVQSAEIVAEPLWAWFMRMGQSIWVAEIDAAFPLWPGAHVLLGLTGLVALSGLIREWRKRPEQRRWLGLLSLHLLIFFLFPLLRFAIQGNVRWTAQGRHVLFPAAVAIPLLLIWGWRGRLGPALRQRLALSVTAFLVVWSLVQIIRSAVDYPPLLPVRTTAAADIKPQSPAYQFGEHLRLEAATVALELEQNALAISLLWRAPTYPNEDYLLNLQLIQAGQVKMDWLAYPINGRYPTRIWESWETIRDDLRLPLAGLPPGEYRVRLQLRRADGPLPVSGSPDSIDKDWLVLDTVTVPTLPSRPPDLPLVVTAENQALVQGLTLWSIQPDPLRPIPIELRPRMAIGLVWQGQPTPAERVQWLVVSEQGDVYPARSALSAFDYFVVGADWPSGRYRLRAEVWRGNQVVASQETGPLLTVTNEYPRQLTPPPIEQPLAVDFATLAGRPAVRLLGYVLPERHVSQGQGTPLMLYWQGLRTMGQSYTVFTKLFDDQQRLWGSAERLPADGYSTIYWLENEVVTDSFELPVNAAAPDGVYWLNVGLYQEVDGEAVSLPVIANGQLAEMTSVTFGPLKVGGPPPGVVVSAASPENPVKTVLGNQIELLGFDLDAGEFASLRTRAPARSVGVHESSLPSTNQLSNQPTNSTNATNAINSTNATNALTLTLYWQSVAPSTVDYTVFAHLRNQVGELVAQADQPPAAGAYPTSLWEPGEIIPDSLRMPLPVDLPPGVYSLTIGLYDFTTGQRLSVPDQVDNDILLTNLRLP